MVTALREGPFIQQRKRNHVNLVAGAMNLFDAESGLPISHDSTTTPNIKETAHDRYHPN